MKKHTFKSSASLFGHRRNGTNFTLIELLVVIAIISILPMQNF